MSNKFNKLIFAILVIVGSLLYFAAYIPEYDADVMLRAIGCFAVALTYKSFCEVFTGDK